MRPSPSMFYGRSTRNQDRRQWEEAENARLKLGKNPSGGTGHKMSQQKRNKARKLRNKRK